MKCIELKSLKLYLWSFRNDGIFYERAVNRILDDLVAAASPKWMRVVGDFNTRGGIESVITAIAWKDTDFLRKRDSGSSFARLVLVQSRSSHALRFFPATKARPTSELTRGRGKRAPDVSSRKHVRPRRKECRAESTEKIRRLRTISSLLNGSETDNRQCAIT